MKPLLLLHGAIGSSQQLLPLQMALAGNYQVYSLKFTGHGGSPLPNEFSIENFAQQVIEFIQEKGFTSVAIFGYSMGGFVALYIAKNFPQYIAEVLTLGTKLSWDPQIAAAEVKMLNPEVIESKVPDFANELRYRHQPTDWKVVLRQTADMLQKLGESHPLPKESFRLISCRVLLMIGDRDKMVSLEETIAVKNILPYGQLAVLPNTPHAIEKVNVELMTLLMVQFIQ
jgi:pimeloyl-ACP methyl ester carboxylesterase